MTPQKLGRYEIVGELGKGAMGLVYLAKDPLIGRQLALKTFRLGFSAKDADRDQFKARFLREAQSAGILSHPNIVTIHDVVVEEDGDFFIAMEYVKGTDLKQLMQRQGRLDVRFVIDIIAQIADGLEYAHSKGVVHRDIKPANIILTAEKQAKITDFGIARVEQSNLTVEGQLLGTPNYMAPEQIQGREVDHRADIFSLGVMLYEMVTGQKPFQGDNLTMVTHRIVYDAFTPPSQLVAGLPERLGKVLEKALEKDANRRYSRGGEMARDLRSVFTSPSSRTDGTASFLTPEETAPADPSGSVPTPVPSGRAPYPLNVTSNSMVSSGTLSGRPGAQTMASAAQEPPSSGLGKGLMIGAIVLLIGALGAVGFFVIQPGEEPQVVTIDPMAELERQYRPLVEQGQAALAAGDPMRAIEFFDQALIIVPGEKEIRRQREEAERMILDEGLTLEEAKLRNRMRQAETALQAKNYPHAIELAQSVLEIDSEHARAAEVLAAAEEGQKKEQDIKNRVQNRFRNQAVTAETPEVPPRERPTPTAPTQKATLEIDFFSAVSEGLLRVFLGGDMLYSEQFAFVSKETGLFGGSKKTSGKLSHRSEIPAGDARLRVYVYRNGATESVELDGAFAADQTRVLRIRVDKDGAVTVRLE